MKALIEVEFTGPDASKGAEVLVSKSNEIAGSVGIPMPACNCRALNYRLVKEMPSEVEASDNSIATAFGLGCGITGLIARIIAFVS